MAFIFSQRHMECWTKQGIARLWFEKSFLPNTEPERPQTLVLDGHDSHSFVEIIEVAMANQTSENIWWPLTGHYPTLYGQSTSKKFLLVYGAPPSKYRHYFYLYFNCKNFRVFQSFTVNNKCWRIIILSAK